MPCYNEEEIVEYTITRLYKAFERSGYRLELVAVDNGSADQTGAIIRRLAKANPLIRVVRIDENVGYGDGVLSGLPLCTARWVGIIPADGQVDAEDVVKLYESILATGGTALVKVRRRFRMDGLFRTFMSTSYNIFVRILWPRLESIDVNGSPKILPRETLEGMSLESKDWLLDPEILIKAHHMGLRVLELNVFARMRGNGLSHVQASTCWEFIRRLLVLRFSRDLSRWNQRRIQVARSLDETAAGHTSAGVN